MRTRYPIVIAGVIAAVGLTTLTAKAVLNFGRAEALRARLADATAYRPIPGDVLARLDGNQRETLERWISLRPELEIIRAYHCNFKMDLESCQQRLAAGNPYLVVGDFNVDGQADFAILLRIKGSDPIRAWLAVFNGSASVPSRQTPALSVEDSDFERLGDQLFVGEDHRHVFFGPAESDNGYLLAPKGDTYELTYQGGGGRTKTPRRPGRVGRAAGLSRHRRRRVRAGLA